jgi:acetyl-CoA acetyltransferase
MRRDPLAAIVGHGLSRISRDPIGSARSLAVEAIMAALNDAGLEVDDIDGLLINRSPSAPVRSLPLAIQRDAGFRNLSVLTCIDGEGCSAIQMIQYASFALAHRLADTIVCVFADARIATSGSGSGYSSVMTVTGDDGWDAHHGLYGAIGPYALAARRYLDHYKLDETALGQYVLSNRRWAQLNEAAFMRKPLAMDEYLGARWIVEPLRLLDCAFPVNGAAAVVVTSADRAGDYEHAVFIHGVGQGHSGTPHTNLHEGELVTGAVLAANQVFGAAQVTPSDVTLCQFYDNFSYVGLQLLEDYGLCPRGEACAFIRDGHTSPGGRLPVATGGGHLSGSYLQGMTPIIEAVVQASRRAGARQVPNTDLILVTGVGGRMDYHAALLMSPMPVLS